MAAVIVLATIGLFAVAEFAGVLAVVRVAIRREETNLALTCEATGTLTRVGRWLNGVYVRAPRPTAAGQAMTRVQPAAVGVPPPSGRRTGPAPQAGSP